MKTPRHRVCALLALVLFFVSLASATAYDGRPRLIVVIVIDQFRGDMLPRHYAEFGDNGFRLLLDHGAVFTDCHYDYANTRTGPGHATLFTGAYSDGHSIGSNRWWDPVTKREVSVVEDRKTNLVGAAGGEGASPHYLTSSTLGDELKMATGGRARVFSISFKDYAAVLPAGYAADAAYWTDRRSGAWLTSSFYRNALPAWVQKFNQEKRADKYWNLEWRDATGKVLRATAPQPGKGFYDVVGATPFANDYQFEFARELVMQEKLGSGSSTDLLAISLSASDILGHKVGPDSPEADAMVLAMDRQLGEFFSFLGRHLGLANVWIVLSADHGVSPLPAYAAKFRLRSTNYDPEELRKHLDSAIGTQFKRAGDYVKVIEWPVLYLNPAAFPAGTSEADAEKAAGEALLPYSVLRYFTRVQLASGQLPADEMGRKYAHSYSPYGGWYVVGVSQPFIIGWATGTDHYSGYSYDTHVPLVFYGLAFQPGTYRTPCEPVDMASTLASLLGINAPSAAVGRVLTEALVPAKEAGR